MSDPLMFAIPDELVERVARRVVEILAREPKPDPGYLDAAGAAEYLATTRDRIYDLKQLGKLRACQDGRRLLFKRRDPDAYLEVGP